MKSLKCFLKRFKLVVCFVQILHNIKAKIKIFIFRYIFCCKKIEQKKIVFENFNGKGYAGYPRIIAEELIKQNVDADYVWISHNKPDNLPHNFRWVKYGTKASFFEYSSAHIWIDNVKNNIKPKKKNGQFYIQTWHSLGPGLKAAEKDAIDKLSKEYICLSIKDSKIIDLMISSCEWQTQNYRKSYWYDGEIMPIELNVNPTDSVRIETKKKVLQYLKLENDINLLLYAPTFRKDNNISCYSLDYKMIKNALEIRFGGKWKVLVRFHPNISDVSFHEYGKDVINVSDYDNIFDLLISSDFYITDYSSPIFDCYRYGIKSAIFASDYDDYCKNDRALYFDLKKLPSTFSNNNNQLYENIINFDEKLYYTEANNLVSKLGYYFEDRELKPIIDLINSII